MLYREIRQPLDTAYSGSVINHDLHLQQLRRLHYRYPRPEAIQGNVADGRYESIEASRLQDLKVLLDRAKPELPPEAVSSLEKMKQYQSSENKLSKDEYKNSIKKVLEILSPETLAEYKNHGIEFVVNEDVDYPTARKAEEGKWKLNLPTTRYEYPIQGLILRCFDEILKVEFAYAKDVAQGSGRQTKIAAGVFLTSRRAKIAARVFQMNMMLGEKYGWDIKGYELAEKYYKDYNNGIRKALEEGLINKSTSKNLLIQIGNKYADRELLDSIMPTKGVPRIFPSMQPGTYFEEFNIKEREIKHKKPILRLRAEEPIALGSPEFYTLMKDINICREKKEDSTLNVVILPDKAIWVLPCRFPEGQKSQHSIVAKGNPCAWAGEVELEGNKIINIQNKSGHYKTYSDGDREQKEIDSFALEAFRQQGYDVPQVAELTVKSYNRDLPRSQNEKDSQRPTDS